jgi:hypothetical protein
MVVVAAVFVSAFVLVYSYSGGAVQLGSGLLLATNAGQTELVVVIQTALTSDCSTTSVHKVLAVVPAVVYNSAPAGADGSMRHTIKQGRCKVGDTQSKYARSSNSALCSSPRLRQQL